MTTIWVDDKQYGITATDSQSFQYIVIGQEEIIEHLTYRKASISLGDDKTDLDVLCSLSIETDSSSYNVSFSESQIECSSLFMVKIPRGLDFADFLDSETLYTHIEISETSGDLIKGFKNEISLDA